MTTRSYRCPTCGSLVTRAVFETQVASAAAATAEAVERVRQKTRWEVEEAHLIAELERLKNTANPYDAQIAEGKARKKRAAHVLADACTDRVALEQAREAHAYWVDAFKEIRLSIIDEALDELEVATNAVAGAMGLQDWEIRFETERETKSKTIQNKFSAAIYPPDATLPVAYEVYCGGEVQRIQMAVTFGLSSVLLARSGLDCNIEVLDEPTAHLSSEGIEDLLVYLAERAQTLQRAVYLVDHRSLDKGAFAGEIRLVKTARGSQVA